MAKAKTKAPKLYYVYGDLNTREPFGVYETLEEMDDVVRLCRGDTVTVIQVVGVKTVERSGMELV